MKSRTLAAIAVGALLLLGGAAAMLRRPAEPAPSHDAGPAARVSFMARPPTGPLLGDAEHGRQLYEINCATCHGVTGDGNGPAATLLGPTARSHRDAAYMMSRPDDLLFQAVLRGGRAVGRSNLMPAWNEVYDKFQIWNLLAFMRSLSPPLPDDATRASYRQTYLSKERHVRIARARWPRLLSSAVLVQAQPADDDEEPRGTVVGRMLFGAVSWEGQATTLALRFTAEGDLVSATTHHQVRVRGEAPDAVDRFLSAQVAGSKEDLRGEFILGRYLRELVDTGGLAMTLILEQEREDLSGAGALAASYYGSPDSLPQGQALYIRNCGACHGLTGRNVGPMTAEREAWPRVLADGTTTARLSDAYLNGLIRKGGSYWNLSGVMPSNEGLTETEVALIVAHVRKLADPPSKGPCPCSALGLSCQGTPGAEGCGCLDGPGSGSRCPQTRR